MVPGIKCLCRDGVLNSDVHRRFLLLGFAVVHVEHVTVEGDVLVEAPLAGAMVNHDVPDGIATEGVLTVHDVGLTTTEAHVANNYVVGVNLERLTRDADALARGRLSGNGDVGGTDIDRRLQTNDARDIEHDDAGTTLFASPAEGARSVVVEIGHRQHFATAASEGVHPPTLGTWESGNTCLTQIVGHASPGNVRTPLLSFFHHNGESYGPS